MIPHQYAATVWLISAIAIGLGLGALSKWACRVEGVCEPTLAHAGSMGFAIAFISVVSAIFVAKWLCEE